MTDDNIDLKQDHETKLEPAPKKVEVEESVFMAKLSCGYFEYAGDSATLGSRWESWSERFELFLQATGEEDPKKCKASYLLLMGPEAYEIHKTKRKVDNTDELAEIQTYMQAHFVAKRSEYSETTEFRKAFRVVGESCSEYAMRLRRLAAHCNYGTALDKEIERQFVVGCRIEEAQREYCRKNNLV